MNTKAKFRAAMRPYLFLLPIFLLAIAFVYYPFLRTLLHSVSVVNHQGQATAFAGWNNFRTLFASPIFNAALHNTLLLVALFVPLNLICSLGMALLAAGRKKLAPLYETMFILPMAVSMPAASMIFKLLLNPTIGVVNYKLGLSIGWFTDAQYALYGIVLLCLWIGIPFDFLLFLSALRSVPEQLLEAARLDGAGGSRRFWSIQLPLVAPTVFYVICTNIVLAMMTSTPVMLITEGGPARSTTTLIYLMFTSGYQSSNYSLAACVSMITFAITFSMVVLAFFFEKRRVHYE